MKLIFLGNELDANVEHELLSDNKCGFKATVIFNDDSWTSLNQGKKVVEIFNNCTEVHNLYETFRNEKRIAFESNIYRTGYTYPVKDIESVEIINETSFN